LALAPGHTTGSPSPGADQSPDELLRAALAALDSGVIRIRDLRALLTTALAALEGTRGNR
jgi:hypothetical protein